MSIRAFHIFFIIMASLMAWGIAAIEYVNYGDVGSRMHLIFSCASIVAALGLMFYAVYFYRKTKNIIIL